MNPSIRPFQSFPPLQNCMAVKDLQLIIAAGTNLASSGRGSGSSRRERSPGPKQRANAFCAVLSSRSQWCRSTHLPRSLFPSASKGRSMKRCTRYALQKPPRALPTKIYFFFHSVDRLLPSIFPPFLPRNEPGGRRTKRQNITTYTISTGDYKLKSGGRGEWLLPPRPRAHP